MSGECQGVWACRDCGFGQHRSDASDCRGVWARGCAVQVERRVPEEAQLGAEKLQVQDAVGDVTPAFCAEAEKSLSETKCNAFICYYDNWFMGRMLRHGDVMHKTAILRLGTGEYEKIDEHGWSSLDMEIHEHLQVEGETGVIKARLEHHDKRSLESYYKKHEEYANWEANRYKALKGDFSKLTKRQQTKYGLIKKWWFGFAYFCACYFLELGILDGKPGYVFARGKWKYFSNIRRKILAG